MTKTMTKTMTEQPLRSSLPNNWDKLNNKEKCNWLYTRMEESERKNYIVDKDVGLESL